MNRGNQGSKIKRFPKSSSRTNEGTRENPADRYLEQILRLIRDHPGIRPSEINRILKIKQSDTFRNTLIKRGLVRKEKDGNAMRYYISKT